MEKMEVVTAATKVLIDNRFFKITRGFVVFFSPHPLHIKKNKI